MVSRAKAICCRVRFHRFTRKKWLNPGKALVQRSLRTTKSSFRRMQAGKAEHQQRLMHWKRMRVYRWDCRDPCSPLIHEQKRCMFKVQSLAQIMAALTSANSLIRFVFPAEPWHVSRSQLICLHRSRPQRMASIKHPQKGTVGIVCECPDTMERLTCLMLSFEIRHPQRQHTSFPARWVVTICHCWVGPVLAPHMANVFSGTLATRMQYLNLAQV